MGNLFFKILKFLLPLLICSMVLYFLLSNKCINGSYLAELYKFKSGLLEKHKQSKKIILIGGSNAKFCYYSPILKKNFPEYEVVNAGLQGNVGLLHSLNYIKPFLTKDDIIILSPEYGMFQTETGLYGNYELVQLMSVYNGVLKGALTDFNQMKSFLAQSLFHYRAFLEIMLIKHVFASEAEVLRVVKEFHNNYGDIINAEGERTFFSYNIAIDTTFNIHAINYLNAYNVYCQSKQVQLFINFPSVAQQSLTKQVEDGLVLDYFKRNFPDIQTLNLPSDGIADKSHFYDSPYHLRTSWQKKNTEFLSKNLKLFIGQQ